MQKNSIKILALAALALSLGACGGGSSGGSSASTSTSESSATSASQSQSESSSESPSSSDPSSSEDIPATLYDISEILTLDAENQWEHLGEKVRVEGLVCQGLYGNTIIGGAAIGEKITDLRGLQIDCAELPVFEKSTGWAALFNVEGTLADVNGRAVVQNAVVEVTSERTAEGGGGSVYYWPAEYMNRGYWDQYLGRNMSSAMIEGVFQLASVPEQITEEQGTSFYVVFPGENLDTEDIDNYSLINVKVEDGMSAAGVKAFNEFFAEKQVGDFATIFASGRYDSVENFGYGLVIESFASRFLEEPAEKPEIFNTWADLTAVVNEHFAEPLPDFGDDRVFSYTYEVGAATTVIKEEYVLVEDKENANCATINYNYKAADGEAIVNFFVGKLETLGWVEGTGDFEGVYTLTVEEKVVGELIIASASETGLSYYYIAAGKTAEPTAETYATFDELVAAYEATAAVRVGEGFESALVDSVPTANEYILDKSYEDSNKEEYDEGVYDYIITFAFNDAITAETVTADYQTALGEAGFVPAMLGNGYDFEGLYNKTTGEIVVFVGANAEKQQLTIEVLALDEEAQAWIGDIPHADFESFDDLKANYETRASKLVEGFTSALITPQADAFTLDWTNETFCYEEYGDEIYTYEMDFYYEQDVSDAVIAAYTILLKDAGFVEKRLADYGIDGLFNPNTNEFVYKLAYDAENHIFSFQVRVLTAKAVDMYIIDIPQSVDFETAMTQFNTGVAGAIDTITGSTGATFNTALACLADNTFGLGYAVDLSGVLANAGLYTNYGILAMSATLEISVNPEVYATLQEAYSELVEILQNNGFVAATFALLNGRAGLWNQTTGEFILVSGSGTTLRVQDFIVNEAAYGYVNVTNA